MLTVNNHSRDIAGYTYVYPVISRRANGLSIGINLNPNNACNWRCIYCQVPDLVRGGAPVIDLDVLNNELLSLLYEIEHGDFYNRFEVLAEQRQIRDIAISGNGEPTSAQEFQSVIKLLSRIRNNHDVLSDCKIVLITNGSLLHQSQVQTGISELANIGGEIWFKLDRATDNGISEINNAAFSVQRAKYNLGIAIKHCTVWIQTSLFSLDEQAPSNDEWKAYLDFLMALKTHSHYQSIRGVLLYGLARQSMQPDASRLGRLSEMTMQKYADGIRELDYEVRVSY